MVKGIFFLIGSRLPPGERKVVDRPLVNEWLLLRGYRLLFHLFYLVGYGTYTEGLRLKAV